MFFLPSQMLPIKEESGLQASANLFIPNGYLEGV